jgi:hypothetical protein
MMAMTAAVVGLTIMLAPVAASARPAAAINQPGTVACTGIKGTITFAPPLTLSGTSPEKTTITMTVTKCKTSGGGVKPKKGTVSQTISKTGSTNNCSSLTSSQSESLTVQWAPSSKINPTTASFSGYTVGSNAAGDEGFILPNSGGTGTAVGSYAEASGVTAAAYSNETSTQLSSACAAGLASLKITSGTVGS